MANKITQLVNESGDNLYPLAGGMAADSISTEMLKDGAVTSDKIDWTTIQKIDVSGYLKAGTSTGTAVIYKFGRVCVLNLAVYVGETVAANTWGYILQNLPANLHPAESIFLSGWENDSHFPLRGIINNGGHVAYMGASSIQSGHYVLVSGAYISEI